MDAHAGITVEKTTIGILKNKNVLNSTINYKECGHRRRQDGGCLVGRGK